MKNKGFSLLIVLILAVNGCALVLQKGRRSDLDKIQILESELDELKGAKDL